VETIKSSIEIDRLFREGARAARSTMAVLGTPIHTGRGPGGRVAFVAGKRLGNAVLRNRCKRVLRETAREAGGPWEGWDVVLIARYSTATTKPEQLRRDLRAALEELGIVG